MIKKNNSKLEETYVSRFDSYPLNFSYNHAKTKICHLKKRSNIFNPRLLSITSSNLLLDGEKYEHSEILNDSFIKNTYIVLTEKEREICCEVLGYFPKNVYSIESRCPFLKGIKYCSNIDNLYHQLKSKIKTLKFWNIDPITYTKDHYSKNHNKIIRNLPYKNEIDNFFYHLPFYGYQEIFKMSDLRKDRKVICLDFNSMYLDCMRDSYPVPDSIYFESDTSKFKTSETMPDGLYKVTLTEPLSEFIKRYHYFRYALQGRTFNFSLDAHSKIVTYLLKEELLYLSKFFGKVEVKNGYIFRKKTTHPLFKKGEKLYRKRIKTNKKELESFYKQEISRLHSTGLVTKTKSTLFSSSDELVQYLQESFFIIKRTEQSISSYLESINNLRNFNIIKQEQGYILHAPDIGTKHNLYCLSYITNARARLKMLKLVESVVSLKFVDICYANIDSLHLSVESDKKPLLLNHLDSYISDNIGDIKIEAIGDTGVWLDIGRYWIIKEKNTIKFKNSIFNRRGNDLPLVDSRKILFNTDQGIEYKYLSLKDVASTRFKLMRNASFYNLYVNRYSIKDVIDLEEKEISTAIQRAYQEGLTRDFIKFLKNTLGNTNISDNSLN